MRPDGHWRRVAAVLVMLGGFADASLAHPDTLQTVDYLLFGAGIASVVAFISFEAVTRPRLGIAALIALASFSAVVADMRRGLTTSEGIIAAIDIMLRVALVGMIVALWARHLERPAPGPGAPPG